MLLAVGLVLLIIAVFPYLIYFAGIHRGKKSSASPIPPLFPDISIIISALNEEAVILDRITNILQSGYPKERYEVIFVDDCSTDNTRLLAEQGFAEAGMTYRIIANKERLGTNRSYNIAIREARFDIIVTTDADVFFEKGALNALIARLLSDDRIAAVCGDLHPLPKESFGTARMEGAYRGYYGRMCEWESAVDATYNFNGALVAFKKKLVNRIDDKRGADDANTAFEAIRRGYRAVYEMGAVVYEDIPVAFGRQYRQKIRRATRLIEATLANLDLLSHKRPFSRIFYPLRLYMYLATPLLFFVACAVVILGLFFVHPVLGLTAPALFLATSLLWQGNTFTAFAVNQLYLLAGLLNLGNDMRVWESTSTKKQKVI
jgi:cellulose synthase/poly-beta-1,6-N-acetylglucosamine synthase-like glycosyltransferase